MDEKENGTKKKKHRHKGAIDNYFKTTAVFVAIALALMIIALLSVNKTATAFVHKLEAAMPMQVRDLEEDPNQSYASLAEVSDGTQYGTLIANLSCESRGLNTSVYYGLNRASLRYGAGVSGENGEVFGASAATVVGGYDETYFMPLKYIQKDDTLTVTAADKIISYKVTAVQLAKQSEAKSLAGDGDLVLYSIYSDFSENSGKCFYVIADKTGEEVNTNE